jgi:hypothetical protein
MTSKNSNLYLDAKTSFLEPVVEQYGGHLLMSNVKKATRVKYVNIDTRFNDEYSNGKYPYNHITSYTISFPEKLRDIKSIRVTNIETPITFYNFSEAIGNTSFTITDTVTNDKKTVVIKDGNYSTAAALKSEIAAQLNILYPLSSPISVDISNNYTRITASSGIYHLDFGVDSSGNFDKHNFRSKLGWALGFRNQRYDLSSSSPAVSESIADLNTVRYLYLVVDEFTSGFTNSFICPLHDYLINKKILARIVVDSHVFPFGSVQLSNTFNGLLMSDIRYYNGKVDVQKMNVQLVNEYGETVDLNGNDFSFLLEVTYE